MGTTADKLTGLNNTKIDIRDAINEKGVEVSTAIPFSQYANKIRAISGATEWQPDPEWWDIKTIIEQDTTKNSYAASYIQLVAASDVTTSLTGANAYKTSDGQLYTTATASHTWDSSKDKLSSNGYKTRWIIYYFNVQTVTRTIDANTIYVIFERALISFNFQNKYALQAIDIINGADLSPTYTNMSYMFYTCYSLQSVPLFNTANVTNMSYMFHSCYSLQSVPLFNTANVTNISNMFYTCYSLQSVPLFNTANVTSMSGMFISCYSLQSVPLFNTANVTNMSNMFYTCYSLQSVPLFNTANVTNMSYMFYTCYSLQSVPLFNTANVTNMSYMFHSCYSLQSVPLFNTANVTNMIGMFINCYSLQSVPLFNTANVIDMSYMFNSCYSLQSVLLNNVKVNFTLNNSNLLSKEVLEAQIEALADLTGQTTQMFTMGATNLAKVSQTYKDLATAKNWGLAA